MSSRWRAPAWVMAVAAAYSLILGCGSKDVMPMDRTGWKTHCIGRFLVELPPDAKVGGTYKIWGDPIGRLSIPKSSIAEVIYRREGELRSTPHETRGTMLIRREDYPSGGASLLSWDFPDSEDFLHIDSYLAAKGGSRAYLTSGLVSPEKRDSAMEFASELNASLRELSDGEIPQGPGYCIDGGFLAGNKFRSEALTVGVTLPGHPGMSITLLTTTQAEVDEETLLDRTAATEVMLLAQGAERLRKGERAAGGGAIPGEEYLMVGVEDGQRKYGFTWESSGKAESVTEPYMTVELQVLGQSVVDEDHPYRPAFASDEEALRLWDAIIESLRPLHGGASAGR